MPETDGARPAGLDRAARAAFFGREAELARLRAGLEEASCGQGRLFPLAGEAGIGKTRTAEVFASHARLRGARVLEGRCYERAGAPPYWPWIQIIRAYREGRGREALEAEMGARATAAIA